MMKNYVVIVKKSALELLCKNYPQFSLRKWFDVHSQQFLITIEESSGNYSNVIYYYNGFEKSNEVHFTYSGDYQLTNFFTYYRIEFSFSETEMVALNQPPLRF